MKVFHDLACMPTCCWGLPKPKYEPFITHNRGTLKPLKNLGHIPLGFSGFNKPTIEHLHLHLHLVIWQTRLSKATYNWGIHKAIHLEEAIRQRKCS